MATEHVRSQIAGTVWLMWQLLRYRVAAMLVLFLLLSITLHGRLEVSLELALAMLALAFGYISATSSNDLADRDIDRINHPGSAGRPLANGRATPGQMWAVFGVGSGLALACGIAVGPAAGAIMLLSVAINVAYSLPPLRLSYRTFLAPLVLGLGYVGVPFLLGAYIAHSPPAWPWLAALYVLFTGRIILKDFRDRKGDARFGKPTFLLKFGKPATCLASAVLIALGGGSMLWLTGNPALGLIAAIYLASILGMLYRLFRSRPGRNEQFAIGAGAKMGNGLLITLTAAFALNQAGAPSGTRILAATVITAVFLGSLGVLLRSPENARSGYRG